MDAGVEMQEDLKVELKGVPQRFSYDELSEATRGFSKESTLGHGGFGVVYRAELKSGAQVAIKRMNPHATHSQGLKEFKSEVFIISQLSHRNLIKLPGWCADVARKEYMLVYDLIPNGSLDDVLFKSAEGKAGLSWAQKFKILTGAADGLDYLHHGLNQQVIHRDIKCSNILLDTEWNAKLGDFGIARMVDHHGRAETTNMAGTLGYIAPEVFSEYQFTDKADVFAFGVVILEVACGRRVLPSPSHKMGLVQWVGSAHSKGDLLSIVDKRHMAYDTKEMKRVLKVGLLCTQFNRQDRPSMRRTVQMLAGDVKVPAIRALKPTSRPFYTPPWLLSMMKPLRHKDASNGSSSLNMLTLVDRDPEVWKVFTDEELEGATNGSSLNMLTLVDRDPEVWKVFTYEELEGATNGFSSRNLLGESKFGWLYKGTIAGNLVAVKVLNDCATCEILLPEVEIMSRVRHRHVVSVLGYCHSVEKRLLVYEYVPNGTLKGALHGPGAPCMDWATRMKIALGTARGLVYLHDKRIIHRDVSASNIHLDDEWDALVGSFGLSWDWAVGLRKTLCRNCGPSYRTFGYADPEDFFTVKSDVYSFGVVLLELITGKKALDRTPWVHLVDWARPLLAHAFATGDVDALADPNLMGKYMKAEMLRMLEVAALCTCLSTEYRPEMQVVLPWLQQKVRVGILREVLKKVLDGRLPSKSCRSPSEIEFPRRKWTQIRL